MVTKGIITSIDFNGNTCQVRIPLFETAGNDPIISTAVVSNTPGSYNGYKVDDVVLVAFEDGKMETPVVIGKLYLGAEKEKADPRGSLNTESLVAAKTAAVPADTKLTTDTDKNLPNTMNPYANLSSIANNLNKLNTDVNYLDVFTNNQFSSVITDVNKQGEQLRSEIKQTANNIEAKVDKEHDGTTTGLGWNLTDTKWTIDATNTAWSPNKLTLFEVDKDGQVIINGNVRIGGYPQSRTRFYKKLAADSESPDAPKENTATEKLPDEDWYETYEWENTSHIWETIQTIAYDTDDKGELQLKITYSTPVDITGAAGEQGISIKSQIIYYAMVDPDITHVEKPDYAPKGSSNQDNHVYGNSAGGNIIDLTTASSVKGYGWSTTPHEYIDGWNYYTSVLTIYSDDDQTVSPAINHRSFADPVKAQELDGVYELAQGKSKNYYSETDPAGTPGNDAYGLTMRKGYCWFDTGYTQISTPEAKSDYLGKWLRIQDANGGYVVKSDENPVRLIQWKDGITDQRYNMIKVSPDNINTLISNKTIVVGTTEAFETGNLKQWDGTDWVDISGELVTNKLTANYINAMDITAKKITVLDKNNNNKPLFEADGINGNGEVTIGGFTVDSNRLYIGAPGKNDSIELSSIHNLIAYKSTNERTASSYAFVKIIVNNDTNLTVYIRSDATSYPDDNYMMVSTPNAAPYPDYYTDSRVKEHTCGQPNTGKNLNDYRRVEYYGLKKDDYILVIYKRGEIATDATDAGYFLIPDTPDISVSGVSSQFSFTKDSSLDINGVAGASLKIGSNFSVDYTGAIKSTSGTIGNFKVSPYGLTFGKDDSTRQFSLKNFTTQLQAYTSKQSIPHNSDNTAVMKVTIKKDSAYFKLFVDSLCSYGLEASHYIIISNLNTESIPTDWTDGGVYYTNADNLYFTNYSDDDYTSHETVYGKVDNAVPVVFKNVKENDYFYIIFKLKQSNDPGYGHTVNSQAVVFIPNNNTCIVSNVSGEYNWIRDTTKDTTIENTTLDIGNKFNVTDDGTLMARTGLFGPWMLTSEKLAYNYNDYLYSSKYKPYLTEAGNNKKKYASAYRYNNAAYWNGDGLILSTQKELDTSTTGWGDYRGPKTVNVGTEISAGGGVESTRIVRKLWNNDLNKFKSFPVICNVNNSVKINSTATNQEKSVITTVDAICTIKVDSTGNNWKKLPKSAYANMVPSFGFIVKTNLNEEYTGISTSNVRIKMSEVSSPIKKVITEVEYKLDHSIINGKTAAGHGTLVLFGKATSGFSEDKN